MSVENAVSPAAPAAPSAPALPTGAPSSSPASFDNAMDAFTSRHIAEDTPPSDAEEAAPPPDVITEDGPADPPDVVVDDEESAAPPAEVAPEEIDPHEEIAPDKTSADGKQLFYAKAKAERLMASDRTVQAIRAIDPSLTVDSIREMYNRTLAVDEMLTDFASGSNPAKIVQTFINPQSSPESVAALMDATLDTAVQLNPAMLSRAVDSVVLRAKAQPKEYIRMTRDLMSDWCRWALNTNDPDYRAIALNLENKWLTPGTWTGKQGAAPRPGQLDPLARREQELTQREQALNLQSQRERQARVEQAVTAANAAVTQTIDAAIESTLAPISAEVRKTRATDYKHAVRDLRDEFEAVTKDNAAYQKQHKVLLDQVRANPTEQTRNALAGFVKSWADYAMGRARKEILSRFASGVTQASSAVHSKQQAVQQRKEPGAGGTAVQRATLKQKLSDPNLSFDQRVDLLARSVETR